MIIFPAIDIRNGKCVRLVKGDFNQETVFSERPEIMAKKWEDEGGQYLHLVDLDGALKGKSQNLDVVEMILKNSEYPCRTRWRYSHYGKYKASFRYGC